MTKSSREKSRKRTYILVRHGKFRRRTFVLRKNVQTRKSIKRSIDNSKQFNIEKRGQKVFSTLQFRDLPNEVIFHVFGYLKMVDILKCGQVSKRFRALSNETWPKKINLCNQKVPVKFLQKLLDHGCEYLSLSESILEGTLNLPKACKLDKESKYRLFRYLRFSEPILEGTVNLPNLPNMPHLTAVKSGCKYMRAILQGAWDLKKASKLKYLNLSGVGIRCNQFQNSEKLLESCYSLQKLSLSKCHLSYNSVDIISHQNGKTLKVLDFSKVVIL